MIEQTAIVVTVAGEMAEVEAEVRPACGTCHADGACSTALLARYFERRRRRIRACNAIGAGPGERVVIGIPEGHMLEASFLAYLVPLFGLIGGALAGVQVADILALGHEEGLSMLAGFGGFGLALLWLRRLGRGASDDPRFVPRVLRRAGGSDAPGLLSAESGFETRPVWKETR